MKFLVVASLAAAAVQADDATVTLCGRILFKVDDPVNMVAIEGDNFIRSGIDALIQGDMEEAPEGMEDLTLSMSEVYVDIGSFNETSLPFNMSGVPNTLSPIIIMGASMAEVFVVELLNRGRLSYYYETQFDDLGLIWGGDDTQPTYGQYPNGDPGVTGDAINGWVLIDPILEADRMPNASGFEIYTCPDANNNADNVLLAKAKVTGSMTLDGITCQDLVNNARDIQEVLIKAVEALLPLKVGGLTLTVDDMDLRAFMASADCDARRRALLAAPSVLSQYTSEDLTVSQIEAAESVANGGDLDADLLASISNLASDETLYTDLGLDSLVVSGSSTTVEAGADFQSLIYTPPVYAKSADVTRLNEAGRLNGGGNEVDIAGMASGGAEPPMDYLIGVGLMAIPCALCLLFSGFCAPCCYCCCIKEPKSARKPILLSPHTWLTIAFTVVGVVGFSMGLSGGNFFQSGLDSLVGSLNEVGTFVNDLDTYMTNMNTSLVSVKTLSSQTSATCSYTENFASMLDVELPASPIAELGLDETLGSTNDQLLQVKGILGTGSLLLVLIPFAISASYTAFILTYKLGKSCAPTKILSCIYSPLVPILLFVAWLLSLLLVIVATLFADVCATDPVATIVDVVDPEGDVGLGYLLACTGKPMDILTMLMEFGALFASIEPVVSNLGVLIETEEACLTAIEGLAAPDTYIPELQTAFSGIATQFLSIIDSVRCKVPNKILTDVLYDNVCGNVVSGAYNLYMGLGLIGLSLVCNYLLWKRVQKEDTKEMKVAPTQPTKASNGVALGKEIEMDVA